MFWRKKQGTNQSFIHEPIDRRNSYRIQPTKDRPIFVTIEGMEIYSAATISAGGISFKSRLSQGESYNASFNLPDAGTSTSLKLEVIKVDQRGYCHCCFNDISESTIESIHQYVLAMQKRAKQPQ